MPCHFQPGVIRQYWKWRGGDDEGDNGEEDGEGDAEGKTTSTETHRQAGTDAQAILGLSVLFGKLLNRSGACIVFVD